MALITVLVDGQGNVVALRHNAPGDLRQRTQESLARDIAAARTLPLGTAGSPAPDAPVRDQPINPIQGLNTDIFLIENVSKGIKESPLLNEQQRADARAVFNTILPGDRIEIRLAPGAVVGQVGVILGGSDTPNVPAPLIARFIDP